MRPEPSALPVPIRHGAGQFNAPTGSELLCTSDPLTNSRQVEPSCEQTTCVQLVVCWPPFARSVSSLKSLLESYPLAMMFIWACDGLAGCTQASRVIWPLKFNNPG